MKALVLGGTKFFGKRLVKGLLDRGDRVTIATRGNQTNPFHRHVEHVRVDRFHLQDLRREFGNRTFDAVYDQICFAPDDALDTCRVFDGRVGRYIFTSSAAVYGSAPNVSTEEAFDPTSVNPGEGRRDAFDYAEGKRRAEAVFAQEAKFPVVMVRPPIVIGPDDSTGRLQFHVKRALEGAPIGMPVPSGQMSFVSADEVGEFLAWIGEIPHEGPINVCSEGTMSAEQIVGVISRVTEREPNISPNSDDPEIASPYGVPHDLFKLDTGRAKGLGFGFSDIMDWLPGVVEEVAEQLHPGRNAHPQGNSIYGG